MIRKLFLAGSWCLCHCLVNCSPLAIARQNDAKPAVKSSRGATIADVQKEPHTGPIEEALVGIPYKSLRIEAETISNLTYILPIGFRCA